MKIKWESSDKYLVGGILATSVGILIPEVPSSIRTTKPTPTKQVLLLGGILGIVVGVVKSENTLDALLFSLI